MIQRLTDMVSAMQEQINGLRERAAEADRLLENEFGGFYLSAQDDEPLGRVRDMLRNNVEGFEEHPGNYGASDGE